MRQTAAVIALIAASAAFAQNPPEERETPATQQPAEPTQQPTQPRPGEQQSGAAAPTEGAQVPPAPPPQNVPEDGETLRQDLAKGSAEAGQAKSATCAACHGADGNSFNPEWPTLAGQHAGYIVQQLEAFQSGARQNVLMTSQAQGLSPQDMRDLAAYYTRQVPQLRTADPELARLGADIYRGGNPETGVTACIACHGPTGSGNPAADYPMVRGQHAVYLASALEAFANDDRRSDPNQVMRNIAALLDDDEIEAVTSYMQGLRQE